MVTNGESIELHFAAEIHWKLIGAINFYNVEPILLRGEQQIKAIAGTHAQATIDFSQVSRCDSAVVAMILNWLHLAKQNNVVLSCIALPVQVLAIIKMANLESILQNSVTGITLL